MMPLCSNNFFFCQMRLLLHVDGYYIYICRSVWEGGRSILVWSSSVQAPCIISRESQWYYWLCYSTSPEDLVYGRSVLFSLFFLFFGGMLQENSFLTRLLVLKDDERIFNLCGDVWTFPKDKPLPGLLNQIWPFHWSTFVVPS